MIVYDSEGNEFSIAGGTENSITLKGAGGEKEIAISDLKYYSAYPPDVMNAIAQIVGMLKSGELTVDQLREMKEAL